MLPIASRCILSFSKFLVSYIINFLVNWRRVIVGRVKYGICYYHLAEVSGAR